MSDAATVGDGGVGASEGPAGEAPSPEGGQAGGAASRPGAGTSPPAAGASPGDGAAGDWQALVAGLPEDLRSSPALQNAKGLEDLARQHVNLSRKIGEKRELAKPDPSWTEEQWSAWHDELGHPAKPDAYDFSDLDWTDLDLLDPDTGEVSPTGEPPLLTRFRELAAQKRIPQDMARAMVELVHQDSRRIQAARAKSREAVEAKRDPLLLAKYGGEEGFAEARRIATAGAEAIFGDALAQFTALELPDGSGALDHPALFDLLVRTGKSVLKEGGLPRAGAAGGAGLEDVEAKLAAFRADPEKQKALNDRRHPQHQEAVDEQLRLYDAVRRVRPRTVADQLRRPIGLGSDGSPRPQG